MGWRNVCLYQPPFFFVFTSHPLSLPCPSLLSILIFFVPSDVELDTTVERFDVGGGL